MCRFLTIVAACLFCVSAASAMDMPTRKAGQWEIKMQFVDGNLPARAMRQCIDQATDKMMNSSFGGDAGSHCSKREIKNVGGTMVVDSVCQFGAGTTTSHAVVSGSFDSAYEVDVTSTRKGGPPIPGMAPNRTTHMKISAKWLGPCPAGMRPGDMMIGNGMKINILDMQKLHGMRPR